MAYRYEVIWPPSKSLVLEFVYSRQEAVVAHVLDYLTPFATIPNLLHFQVSLFRLALPIFVHCVEDPLLIQHTLLIFVEWLYDVFEN